MAFTYDKALTANRITRLSQYMESNVLRGEEFICKNYVACKCSRRGPFSEGQMHHVGTHYDLFENGVPLRIMVVGQEDGSQNPKVSFAARHEQIVNEIGYGKRFKTTDDHKGRNKHMKGTTSALRLLVGRQPGTDYESEFIRFDDNTYCHLFDAFALVNALLCAAHVKEEKSEGNASSLMFKNCGQHFRAAVEILEPTVMVVQGSRVWSQVKQVLGNPVQEDSNLYRTKINRQPTWIAVFHHPSAQDIQYNWGSNERIPYLQDVVSPTIGQIRSRVTVRES